MVRISISGKPHINYQGPVLERKTKKCIIRFVTDFKARANGEYGWDKLTTPLSSNCTSDVTALEDAYTIIEVAGDPYFAPYLSMRKGQSITLKLKKTIWRKKDYSSIAIDPLPGFTIEPMDIMEADSVTITCKTNAETLSQLTVTADNDPAGALSIWHPVPKTAKVTWVMLETKNDGEDKKNIEKLIDTPKLIKYFQKAFNPSLIDIELLNAEPELLDLTTLDPNDRIANQYRTEIDSCFTNPKKRKRIGFAEANKNHLMNNVANLYRHQRTAQKRAVAQDEIVLFLTDLKCFQENSDGTNNSYNGGTKAGNSIMFLNNDDKEPEVEIPHEIMHAIGAPHTFVENTKKDAKKPHTFTLGSTDNYMDYNNPNKEHTYYWQWNLMHHNPYTK